MPRLFRDHKGTLRLTVAPTPQHLDPGMVLAILADTEAGETDQPLTAQQITTLIRDALTFNGIERYYFVAEKHDDWAKRVRAAHPQLARVWPAIAEEADWKGLASLNPGDDEEDNE